MTREKRGGRSLSVRPETYEAIKAAKRLHCPAGVLIEAMLNQEIRKEKHK